MNVAFVTYNTVGENRLSGWVEQNGHRAFVMQNTKGISWGAGVAPKDYGTIEGPTSKLTENRFSEIEQMWLILREMIHEFDRVVVYLGASRAQARIIELVSMVSAAKITFVSCRCDLVAKEICVQLAGLDACERRTCECGGHRTMETLLVSYLETGEV